jgi:hypothetical protein
VTANSESQPDKLLPVRDPDNNEPAAQAPSRADLLPARPADQWETATEEEEEVVAAPARTAERPLQVPRQREELKKDLLEAIKRKISKNKPGGGEEQRLEGDHHQVGVCVCVCVCF